MPNLINGPRFSVLIATFNRSSYVLEAIRSVLEQTHPAYEIILVDDGSADSTAEIVRQKYPSVQVIKQQNLGPSVAHNTGVAAASGDWVCFLDDDDLWHREKLAVTAEYLLSHPECRALRNPVWFFTSDAGGPEHGFGFARDFAADSLEGCHAAVTGNDMSKNTFDYLEIEGNSLRLLLERNRGVMSSSVVHRETFLRAGGFCPMQTCGDDWTMFVNVARLTEWHTLKRRLGFTRFHANQNTYDALNGLFTVVGYANAWLTGRPLRERLSFREVLKTLESYGPIYRTMVQQYFWGALWKGRWQLARMILTAGRLLLPRWRDQLFVLIPPQITWRIRRHLLRDNC